MRVDRPGGVAGPIAHGGGVRCSRLDGGGVQATDPVAIAAGGALAAAAGDIDRDGSPDVVAVSASGRLSWHRQLSRSSSSAAAGSFDHGQTVAGSGCMAAVAADIDNDGWLDILCAGPTQLMVFRNRANLTELHANSSAAAGGFDRRVLPTGHSTSRPPVLLLADLDNDGWTDLVDVVVAPSPTEGLRVGWRRNRNGHFKLFVGFEGVATAAGVSLEGRLQVVDADMDGWSDLMLLTEDGVSIARSKGVEDGQPLQYHALQHLVGDGSTTAFAAADWSGAGAEPQLLLSSDSAGQLQLHHCAEFTWTLAVVLIIAGFLFVAFCCLICSCYHGNCVGAACNSCARVTENRICCSCAPSPSTERRDELEVKRQGKIRAEADRWKVKARADAEKDEHDGPSAESLRDSALQSLLCRPSVPASLLCVWRHEPRCRCFTIAKSFCVTRSPEVHTSSGYMEPRGPHWTSPDFSPSSTSSCEVLVVTDSGLTGFIGVATTCSPSCSSSGLPPKRQAILRPQEIMKGTQRGCSQKNPSTHSASIQSAGPSWAEASAMTRVEV